MARKTQPTNGALAERLDRATRRNGQFDRTACIKFARANGIALQFDRLDNGRCAMNVRNAIRKMAKAGEKVAWPK